jgi:hypothetical protein
MNLPQQIIQDRAEALAGQLHIDIDAAFMCLVHSLVTGKSTHDFDPNDVVDGGQDKQMDLITIEEDDESTDVYVIQSKNTTSFSSNALIQLHNGLSWLFEHSRKDIDTLTNKALRDKILEYRATLSSLGPSNIRVHVRFVANGSTQELSEEFKQERAAILDDYDNDTFEHFSIEALGCDELIELSKAQERQTRRVDADLRIRYDTNNPSLIKYYSQGLKGLVCSVPALEIAKLVNDHPDGSIFDLNIRRFLSTRGSVNRDIHSTCSNVESSYEFWFLNNGITIVCDQFDPVTDPDHPHVKLKNLQIVNGCQTATTLALAQREGKLSQDVRVLTRIYETSDPTLVSRIVLTTNNQNQIKSRDLRANDPVQLDMEEGFRNYGFLYERKPRQYDETTIDPTRFFTNEAVAQCYLAIVLKAPSDGRARKYKVWGELHSRIFSGQSIEPYIVAALIGRSASDWLRGTPYATSEEEVLRIIAKRGSFHIGRIAAYLWRGSDDWNLDRATLQALLAELQGGKLCLEKLFEEAFSVLSRLVKGSAEYSGDVDRALKSALLDKEIDRQLHKNGKDG